MNLGETYLRRAEGGHLWVIVTLPATDGSVVAVSFQTHHFGLDENCVIEAGEHPFATRKTVVAYDKAQTLTTVQQAKILALPAHMPRLADVSATLLERIQKGALTSDETVEKIQKAIAASMEQQAGE